MTCPRCQGLMVSVTLEDAEWSRSREPSLGWRCLLCGEVVDPTIADNRKIRPKPLPRKPTPRLRVLIGESAHRGHKHKRG